MGSFELGGTPPIGEGGWKGPPQELPGMTRQAMTNMNAMALERSPVTTRRGEQRCMTRTYPDALHQARGRGATGNPHGSRPGSGHGPIGHGRWRVTPTRVGTAALPESW